MRVCTEIWVSQQPTVSHLLLLYCTVTGARADIFGYSLFEQICPNNLRLLDTKDTSINQHQWRGSNFFTTSAPGGLQVSPTYLSVGRCSCKQQGSRSSCCCPFVRVELFVFSHNAAKPLRVWEQSVVFRNSVFTCHENNIQDTWYSRPCIGSIVGSRLRW